MPLEKLGDLSIELVTLTQTMIVALGKLLPSSGP